MNNDNSDNELMFTIVSEIQPNDWKTFVNES